MLEQRLDNMLSNVPTVLRIFELVLRICEFLDYTSLCSLLRTSAGVHRMVSIKYRYQRKTEYLTSLRINPEYIARLYQNRKYLKFIKGSSLRKLSNGEIQNLISSFEQLENIPYSEYKFLSMSIVGLLKKS